VIRATLDTNVLVSGLAALALPASPPGAVLRYWREGRFELIVSAAILEELERTFAKPYYATRRSPSEIAAAMRAVATRATLVVPSIEVAGVATHREDDLVLSTAVSASVDYLVTGDKQLQRLGEFQGVRIVGPREFLDFLEFASGESS
jgi:uncharacterized protein